MTFLRRFLPLAAIIAISALAFGQGTATAVQGTDADGVAITAWGMNLPGSIAAGTSLDSNGDLTVSDDILAGGDVEGANLTGTNTGNVTIATGAAADILTIGGTGGQVLDVDPIAANTFLAGPASGSAAKPAPRALVADDIPASLGTTEFSALTVTTGDTFINGTTFQVNAATVTNIQNITPGSGTLAVDGTVAATSISIAGSPGTITASGAITGLKDIQPAAGAAGIGEVVVLEVTAGDQTLAMPAAAAGKWLTVVTFETGGTTTLTTAASQGFFFADDNGATVETATPGAITLVCTDANRWVVTSATGAWAIPAP